MLRIPRRWGALGGGVPSCVQPNAIPSREPLTYDPMDDLLYAPRHDPR